MRRGLPWLAAAFLVTGCADPYLVIESNTAWAGTIEGYGDVSGRGNASLEVGGAPSKFCWRIAKTTSAGTLRVYLRDKPAFTLGTSYESDQTTTAPNGVVEGCDR